MDRDRIAVATMTLARTAEEEALLYAALRALSEAGMPVAITDGGSSAEFVETLRRLPGVDVRSVAGRGGLVAQVRQSLDVARAWNRPRTLYTEPDKLAFFRNGLREFLDAVEDSDDLGVVLAARSEAGFATFPPIQQYTESVFNRLCGDVTGVPADYLYGPLVMNPALATYLETAPAGIGWGWRPFVAVIARRLGMRLAAVPGPFHCPPGQREDDDAQRLHRMRQLAQNIDGLTNAAVWPLPGRSG